MESKGCSLAQIISLKGSYKLETVGLKKVETVETVTWKQWKHLETLKKGYRFHEKTR